MNHDTSGGWLVRVSSSCLRCPNPSKVGKRKVGKREAAPTLEETVWSIILDLVSKRGSEAYR